MLRWGGQCCAPPSPLDGILRLLFCCLQPLLLLGPSTAAACIFHARSLCAGGACGASWGAAGGTECAVGGGAANQRCTDGVRGGECCCCTQRCIGPAAGHRGCGSLHWTSLVLHCVLDWGCPACLDWGCPSVVRKRPTCATECPVCSTARPACPAVPRLTALPIVAAAAPRSAKLASPAARASASC